MRYLSTQMDAGRTMQGEPMTSYSSAPTGYRSTLTAYSRTLAAPAPRLRITPRGRAVLAVLVSLPLVLAAYLGAGALGLGVSSAEATGTSAGADAFAYVSVEPGQSLWQLAEQVAPHADPREVVADILVLNNLASADVQPGQELAIPAQYLP